MNYWENYKFMYADELPTRDDVKRWMLEQQLGRRNLSEAEKYEIVQKFKSVFEQKAKKNQSLGVKVDQICQRLTHEKKWQRQQVFQKVHTERWT